MQRLAFEVPARPAHIGPEVALATEQVEVIAAQVDRHLGVAQVDDTLVGPTAVSVKRQDGNRSLGGIRTPAMVIDPHIGTVIRAASETMGRQDGDFGVGRDTGMVVIRTPALGTDLEMVLNQHAVSLREVRGETSEARHQKSVAKGQRDSGY